MTLRSLIKIHRLLNYRRFYHVPKELSQNFVQVRPADTKDILKDQIPIVKD